jgi:hypothetical protein
MGYDINYHQCRRANIHSAISVIKEGLFLSGLKSLFANLLLGLNESSFICSSTLWSFKRGSPVRLLKVMTHRSARKAPN